MSVLSRERADVIVVRGVRALGRHGVLSHEKTDAQPFVVDLDLEVDLSWAGAADRLADTVSYADIAAAVVTRLTGPSVDLIETLAHRIAADALTHDLVEAVTVTVHKPQAPVGVEFGDVGVRIRRGQGRLAVVALGANLPGPQGDRAQTLASAALRLDALPGTRLVALSPLVESDAVTLVASPAEPDPGYLNAVAVVQTDLHPRTLLAALHELEAEHGRVREARWGPRTVDLDLVDVRARDARRGEVDAAGLGPSLRLGGVGCPGGPGDPSGSGGSGGSGAPGGSPTLPHPRAIERDFVLAPWAQVDPRGAHRFVAEHGPGRGEAGPDGAAPAAALLAGADLRPGPPWPPAARPFVRRLGDPPARAGAPDLPAVGAGGPS